MNDQPSTYWLPAISRFSSACTLFLAGGLALTGAAHAQDELQDQFQARLQDQLPDSPGAVAGDSATSTSALPESPDQTQGPPPAGPHNAAPKRIFGIIPNFRTVSTTEKLPPQTVKDKFADTTQDSFDYSSLALVAAVSAYGYGRNQTPEFGRGGVAFGRYIWHSAVDQTVENYLVEFIIPVVAHEDTRFYTLTSGSFGKRAGYSLGRVFVTRTDSGRQTFNSGEIFGAAIASGISNFYYPRGERTFGNFAEKYGTNIGIDAASYFIKEFYPEISHGFSRKKKDGTPK